MDLRRLRYFVMCAEELHFTRAARRLGIAQPPLSQQIQVLEKEIGTRLFHRLSRGVELTPAGRSLLRDARAILDLAERAVITAQQIGKGERGSIRIGFTSSASFNPVVPTLISEFRAKHLKVEVMLSENTTTVALEFLRDGRLDLAFLRPASGETDGLRSRLLFEEKMMIALPARHPLATSKKLSLSALSSSRSFFIPGSMGERSSTPLSAVAKMQASVPGIVQEAPQMASTVSLVAAGVGVAIVPASMSQLQNHGVTYREIVGVAPRAALSLVWRDGPLSAVMEDFIEATRQSTSSERKRAGS